MNEDHQQEPKALELCVDPTHSAWVSAHAGSGKTRMLTWRLLSLLLHGVTPHAIVCLTYTRAAAAEIRSRVIETLQSWISLSNEELLNQNQEIFGPRIDRHQLPQRIKAILHQAIQQRGGLVIYTFHQFCLMLLQSFPHEAGLRPGFHVITPSDQWRIKQLVLTRALSDPTTRDQLTYLTRHTLAQANEIDNLIDFVQNDAVTRRLLQTANTEHDQALLSDQWSRSMAQALDLDEKQPLISGDPITRFLQESERPDLQQIQHDMQEGKTTAQDWAKKAQQWLNIPLKERPARLWTHYAILFLTQKGTPRKKLGDQSVSRQRVHQQVADQEAQELGKLQQYLYWHGHRTKFWPLLWRLHDLHQQIKTQMGVLDFNDLISKARYLLSRSDMRDWIRFKLDTRFHHILVDEAQDTSPDQWGIVDAITDDFFAGESAYTPPDTATNIPRTLFVVGDVKQSIYRFQGAEPESFPSWQASFAARIEKSGQILHKPGLNKSYRCGLSILNLVDATFGIGQDPANNPEQRAIGLGQPIETHQAGHSHKGIARLWYFQRPAHQQRSEQPQSPDPSTTNTPEILDDTQSTELSIAQEIAYQITLRLSSNNINNTTKCSHHQTLDPSDILILCRSRNPLFHEIPRQLQKLGIPVAAPDRLPLRESLAVLDVLALLRWCLSNSDDLSLAQVLRSPLVSMPSDRLWHLCATRSDSLFHSLQESAQHDGELSAVCQWLQAVRHFALTQPPERVLASILHGAAPLMNHPHPEANDQTPTTVSGRASFARRLGKQSHEELDMLNEQALEAKRHGVTSCGGFIDWVRQTGVEIKREYQSSNGVQILTIHGAKGLEAKLVFVVLSEREQHRTPICAALPLSHQAKMTPILLRRPHTGTLGKITIDTLSQQHTDRENHESLRLLYVALTRASNELIVVATVAPPKTSTASSSSQTSDESHLWLRTLQNGFEQLRRLGKAEQKTFSPQNPFPNPQTRWLDSWQTWQPSDSPEESLASPSALESLASPASTSPANNPQLIPSPSPFNPESSPPPTIINWPVRPLPTPQPLPSPSFLKKNQHYRLPTIQGILAHELCQGHISPTVSRSWIQRRLHLLMLRQAAGDPVMAQIEENKALSQQMIDHLSEGLYNMFHDPRTRPFFILEPGDHLLTEVELLYHSSVSKTERMYRVDRIIQRSDEKTIWVADIKTGSQSRSHDKAVHQVQQYATMLELGLTRGSRTRWLCQPWLLWLFDDHHQPLARAEYVATIRPARES